VVQSEKLPESEVENISASVSRVHAVLLFVLLDLVLVHCGPLGFHYEPEARQRPSRSGFLSPS